MHNSVGTQTLNDTQWKALEHLFQEPEKTGPGKPHAPWRKVVNSILFVLTTGMKWATIPQNREHFATKSVSNRWYIEWTKNSQKLKEILSILGMEDSSTVQLPPTRNRLGRIQNIADQQLKDSVRATQ